MSAQPDFKSRHISAMLYCISHTKPGNGSASASGPKMGGRISEATEKNKTVPPNLKGNICPLGITTFLCPSICFTCKVLC